MKTIANILIGIISIFCMTGFIASTAEASDYIGDFCWQDEGESEDQITKLGVSDLGGGH